MLLEKIHLINFKNYEFLEMTFGNGLNCILGNNGSGKTNLLDAIYCLAFTKSYFGLTDMQNIRHSENFLVVNGSFRKENQTENNDALTEFQTENIAFGVREGKKTIKSSVNNYQKASEHIGLYPVVMLTPYDTDLVREGSEERRKFLDGIISQISNEYLQNLLKYNHLLKERNITLKRFAEKNTFDAILLESFDVRLLEKGKLIFEERKRFLGVFLPIFQKFYQILSENNEIVSLDYQTQYLQENGAENIENFESIFKKNLQKDRLLMRTSAGVHKDDLDFLLEKRSLRKFGSQGQQKTYVIALKLAAFATIKQEKNICPLLLLDDIFDKLDAKRMQKLLQIVSFAPFGQVFLTDANPERTKALLKEIKQENQQENQQENEISTFILEKI